MSVNFLFILLGILELGFAETLVFGDRCHPGAVFLSRPAQPAPGHVQICAGAVSIAVAYNVYHLALSRPADREPALAAGLGAITYFVANTGSIAAVISLTEGKGPSEASGWNAISGRSLITWWARHSPE